MKSHIWIMNHYAGNMYFENGGRHYSFAKYLKRKGYEPTIFCANSKHNAPGCYFETSTLWHEHMAAEISVPFVFVKTCAYTGNGRQRVLNMTEFYRNVQKAAEEYTVQHGKPDIILASSVHPLTLVAGTRLAKRFGVECICEVRDLWPESIVEYSSRFTKKNSLIKLLYQGEKWIYKKADKLLFTMEGGKDYIVEQRWDIAHGGPIDLDKVHHINNGVDLEVFHYNRDHYQADDPDLEDPDIFKVVYTGSIRRVNNLGLVLDAAKEVRNPRVKFLVWGDGDELSALRQRTVNEHIENVVFKGKVEKKYIPSIVSRADLNYMHSTPTPLFRFGISPNKLFDYLATEKPILSDFTSKYNPAEQEHAGITADPPDPTHIAAKIDEMAGADTETYLSFCQNAARAAEQYDFKALTEKLIHIIEKERM